VRPLVNEAWRCYNAGAVRAAITATWTAVAADIIDKIVRLADEGEPEATTFRDTVTNAQEQDITSAGVKAMQKIEDSLLANAEKFELIDSIGTRELGRIREDRNLCVHPSLRHLGDAYEPQPEVARGHLAVALSTLLIHPPTQGRKALDEFKTYVCDPLSVPSVAHIQATFFDRARAATKRNIVKFAAKHALLELSAGPFDQPPPAQLADRMAEAVKAFALRDRELVRTALADLSSRFQPLEIGTQLRTVVRLGDQDFFWDMVDQALATRLNDALGGQLPIGQFDPLPTELAAQLALVRNENARQRLPILVRRFTTMEQMHRIGIAASHPDSYFIPAIITFMSEAGSWRTGEQVGQLAVQHGPFFTIETLRAVLTNWAGNLDCRTASLMPELAVAFSTPPPTSAQRGRPRSRTS
jgi:hypothetical protein